MNVRHILADSYIRLKDETAALAQLVAMIQSHPDGVERGVSASYALLESEADRAFTHNIAQILIQRFPESPGAQFTLARLSAAMGDKTSTITALNDALMLKADHIGAILLRADTLVEMDESEHAFKQLRSALEKSPNDVTLSLGHARLLMRSGRHDAAMQAMASIYGLRSDDATVVLSLGLMALEAQRLTESKTYLNHVLAIGQRVSEAHYYLARIADIQREYDIAIDHYSRVDSGEWQLDRKRALSNCWLYWGISIRRIFGCNVCGN